MKVYSYEAEFDIGTDAITWTASVSAGGVQLEPLSGAIALTSPALTTLAEQAVRDEIVKRIDTLDDAKYGVGPRKTSE